MKYYNKKTEWNGIKFDSRAELEYYQQLLILQSCGEISELRRQVKFLLIPGSDGERSTAYVCDFVYKNKNGDLCADEFKGSKFTMTEVYKIKRKLFKIKYPEYKFIETVGGKR